MAFGCAAVSAVAYVVLPDRSGAQASVLALSVLAAGLVVGFRLHRESLFGSPPWAFLGAGWVAYAVATVVWSFGQGLYVLPFPSPVDLGFLAGYLLWCAFLVGVTRAPEGDPARRNVAIPLVDAGIFTCAGLAVLWPGVVSAYLADPATTGMAEAVALAYPVALAFLFGLALHVAVSGVARRLPGALVLLWVAGELAAAVGYSFLSVEGMSALGHPTSLAWFVSYAALAAFALHPRMSAVMSPRPTRPARNAWRESLILAGPLTPVVVWVVAVDRVSDQDWSSTESGLLGLTVAGFVLVFVRLQLVSSDLTQQRRLTHDLETAVSALADQRDALQVFSALVASTKEAVIVTTAEGKVLQWNHAAEHVYGYTADEAVGQSASRLYRSETTHVFAELIETARTAGDVSFDKPVLRRDGREIQVSGSLSAILDQTGNVTQLVGISRDVTEATRLRVELEDSARELREGQRLAGAGSWQWDALADTVTWSDEMYRLFGLEPGELVATYQAYLDRVHPDDRQQVRDVVDSVFTGADEFNFDHRIVRPDGQVVWVASTAGVVRDAGGVPVRVVGHSININASKLAEQELLAQRDRLAVHAAVVQSTDDAIIVTSPEGTIVAWNAGAERLYGYSADEAVGRSIGLITPSDGGRRLADIKEALTHGHVRIESVDIRKNGSPVITSMTLSPVGTSDGRPTVVVGVVRDITEQKRALEREREQATQLGHMAFHDPLTGLANRALVKDRLTQALLTRDRRTTVLLLDLDDFKVVNDVSGHAAGDQMLVEVARRLTTCVRGEDTVGRLGGDEFAVVIQGDDEAVDHVAGRILEEVSVPLTIDNRDLIPTCSIGIAVNDDTNEVDELFRRADLAMYAAKAAGKSSTVRFTAEMAHGVRARADLQGKLRQAVSRAEIVVHYQPILDVQAQSMSHMEALVRWRRPDRLVPPGEFLRIAEETDLIINIGAEVLRQSCEELNDWLSQNGRRSLAVNVSARQLTHERFADDVERVLDGSGLRPGQLVLEVTETLFLDPGRGVIDRLAALRALGVRVAIDDFGTGYSSLGRLQALPIDSLKIDKSFVELIRTGREDLPILTSMILMAHSLGLNVTAEGVEKHEQAERLMALGCDYLQGYHFARPAPLHVALTTATDQAMSAFNAIVGTEQGGSVVVVIEDDAASAALVRMTLTAAGFDVEHALTGAEGLAVVDRLTPDCVLVDLGLPDMDGLEVVRALRGRVDLASTAIVVLTGAAQRVLKAAAFAAGADDYIVKPLAPQHLPERVRGAIRSAARAPFLSSDAGRPVPDHGP